jgi:hypothetical protein
MLTITDSTLTSPHTIAPRDLWITPDDQLSTQPSAGSRLLCRQGGVLDPWLAERYGVTRYLEDLTMAVETQQTKTISSKQTKAVTTKKTKDG